jgi:WhiB family redox-sensing transcriptional regulator
MSTETMAGSVSRGGGHAANTAAPLPPEGGPPHPNTLTLSADPAGLAWQDLALCAEVDPDLFFPEKGDSTAAARRVCAACEVRAQCLVWALDHGEIHGVWGGVTGRARRGLRRAAAS